MLSQTLEGILNPDDVVLSDLPDSPWNWDRKTRIKAQGLLSTIKTAMFIVAFITVKNCLEIIKPLSIKLQKRDQDIYDAYTNIDKDKESVSKLRDRINEEFRVWFNDAKKIAESVGSQVSKTRAVGRQRHRANAESETDEEYFRRNVAIPFCDFF